MDICRVGETLIQDLGSVAQLAVPDISSGYFLGASGDKADQGFKKIHMLKAKYLSCQHALQPTVTLTLRRTSFVTHVPKNAEASSPSSYDKP